MLPKNNNKYVFQEQNNQEINYKKQTTFKNLYVQIKKNIKVSYSKTKQKNIININNPKKLAENSSKKIQDNNLNLIFPKKTEESRNYFINNFDKMDENNQDEKMFNYDENFILNKTQKNIKLINIAKIKKNLTKPKNNIINEEQEKINRKVKLYSNPSKENYNKDDIKKIRNKLVTSKNKKLRSNKEITKMNFSNNYTKNNNSENNDSKIKSSQKYSFEKIPKLLINKKIFSKEEILKAKEFSEKVKSARYGNNANRLLIINNDINEIKTFSNKKSFRINSQKSVKIKNDDISNLDTNQTKNIKNNKYIEQIKQNNKNHSLNLNKNNKILLLNETLKEKTNKKKNKFSIVNIYNCPNIRNNNKQKIPYAKDIEFYNSEKKNSNKDDKENTFINNHNYNEHTIYKISQTSNKNSNTKNNNRITPISKIQNNSFSNPYNNKEKISSFFYSKPFSGLKKRIFNSPSDKDENSNNNIEINEFNNNINNIYKNNDLLELNNKENNCNFKDLLITIKILSQIINTQKKIINEHIQNENNLKFEIEQKNKEIKNYKDICLKLIFYLKNEREINISNELNKKRNIIHTQIIKENYFLRQILFSSNYTIKELINNKSKVNNFEMNSHNNYKSNNNENNSSYNFYQLNKKNYRKIDVKNMKEIKEVRINHLYNNDIFKNSIINKKREKSYENRRDKNNIDKLENSIKIDGVFKET